QMLKLHMKKTMGNGAAAVYFVWGLHSCFASTSQEQCGVSTAVSHLLSKNSVGFSQLFQSTSPGQCGVGGKNLSINQKIGFRATTKAAKEKHNFPLCIRGLLILIIRLARSVHDHE
ncbi:2127_t:CDS:2, partial [Racocetra persica]